LERHNIKIIIGHNTSDYLLLTKKYRFDYIFCDINLDYEFEGVDIVKMHKKRNLKRKIVAFTSGNFTDEMIFKLGFDFYLNKNIESVELFIRKRMITMKNQNISV
jgi:DNA-binding response OmpR family regulator